MRHDLQVQLIQRILDLDAQNLSDMDESESQISVRDYLDPQRFEQEYQSAIRKQPLIIARSSQLQKTGDFLTHDDSGVPLLIVRNQEGSIDVFLNVCRHRGTKLEQAKQGCAKIFVCPYHSWSYGIDGSLKGIPHSRGFPNIIPSERGLVKLPSEEKFGFIWTILTPNTPLDVGTWLGPLCEDFEALGFEHHVMYDERRFVRPINWKLTIDTFLENYHVRSAHRTSIDHYFLDHVGLYEQNGPHVRNVYPKKTIRSLRNSDSSTWDIRPHANLLYCIFPNTLILIEPDHFGFSTVYPNGIEETILIGYTLVPEEPTEKAKNYWDKNNEILYNALEEDFTMARRVQQCLRSGANESLIHGRYEKGLKYYHQTLDKVLGK
jgi:phenylpropionate dioxygenase-like ring-hydroxylating dioxygenase large terminal subunit